VIVTKIYATRHASKDGDIMPNLLHGTIRELESPSVVSHVIKKRVTRAAPFWSDAIVMRRILNLAPQIVVRDTATLSYDYENGMTEGWKFP